MLDDLVDHLFSDTFVIHVKSSSFFPFYFQMYERFLSLFKDQQLHDKSLLVKGREMEREKRKEDLRTTTNNKSKK